MKYRRKSPAIKAFCLGRESPPKWVKRSASLGFIHVNSGNVWVKTPFGEKPNLIPANSGDYIVENTEGFLEVYDPDTFLDLYEPLKEKK